MTRHAGCAKHVGRVGTLAVALGIGMAVASTPATAWADSKSSESGSTAGPSGSSESSAEKKSKADHKAGAAAGSKSKAGPVRGHATSTDDKTPADNKIDLPVDKSEDVDEPADTPDTDDVDTPKTSEDSVTTESVDAPADDRESTEQPRSPRSKADITATPQRAAEPSVPAHNVIEDSVPQRPAPQDAPAPAPQTLDAVPVTAPTRVTTPAPIPDVLGIIGASLASLSAPAPRDSGGGAATLWTVLAWARGQFYNSRPVFDYRPDIDQSPALDGTDHILIANRSGDPDGDPARVVAVTNGAKGTVTINPDGGLTYDPGPDYDGDDTFTVTVSGRGSGWHLPGLEMFGIGGSNTTTSAVNVTLKPVAAPRGDDARVTAIRHNALEPDIEVRYSADGTRAYIRTFKADTFDATVTVMDTTTGAVVHDFDVPGTEYASDIELSTDGRHLIIARQGGQAYWIDTVNVHTGETTTLSGGLPVGFPDLELSPDSTRTLITWRDPGTRNYNTTVLDTTTGAGLGTIEGGVSAPRYHFGSDGGFLITDAFDRVTAADADGNVVATVTAGGGVGTVVRVPNRAVSYVAYLDSFEQQHYVAVLDDTTHEVVARVPSGPGAAPTLTLAPDGNRLYLSSGAQITVLDTGSSTVVGSFTAPGDAVGPVAVSGDSATVYVVSARSGQGAESSSLLAVDAATGQITGTVNLGDSTIDQLVVSADGTRAYVAGRPGGGTTTTVAVVDLRTNRVAGTAYSVDNATATDLQLSGNGELLLANVSDEGGYGYSSVVAIATGAAEPVLAV